MTSHTGTDDARSRLHVLRAATERSVASLVASVDGIVEATADVATDDEHDPEGNTIAWERQQIAGLLDKARQTLTDIEVAEQRIDEGRYGICMTCRVEIGVARLDALPATPNCVSCAT